jgi:hypothetical protein
VWVILEAVWCLPSVVLAVYFVFICPAAAVSLLLLLLLLFCCCSYFAMLINKAPEQLVMPTANYTLDW